MMKSKHNGLQNRISPDGNPAAPSNFEASEKRIEMLGSTSQPWLFRSRKLMENA